MKPTTNLDNLLPRIESHLKAAFRPVVPPTDFMQDLKRRLVSKPVVSVSFKDQEAIRYAALALVGLMGGILTLFLGAWIIKAVINYYRYMGGIKS